MRKVRLLFALIFSSPSLLKLYALLICIYVHTGDGRYVLSNGKDQTARLFDLRSMSPASVTESNPSAARRWGTVRPLVISSSSFLCNVEAYAYLVSLVGV